MCCGYFQSEKLRFFGRLRDTIGDEREIILPPEVRDSEQLRTWLGRDHPDLLDPAIRIALDDEMLVASTPLGATREAAFLPPVSGG